MLSAILQGEHPQGPQSNAVLVMGTFFFQMERCTQTTSCFDMNYSELHY
jgi:hypothetical protein